MSPTAHIPCSPVSQRLCCPTTRGFCFPLTQKINWSCFLALVWLDSQLFLQACSLANYNIQILSGQRLDSGVGQHYLCCPIVSPACAHRTVITHSVKRLLYGYKATNTLLWLSGSYEGLPGVCVTVTKFLFNNY